MTELFIAQARELCEKHDFKLIFLCEKGSRIKGYSCAESDYDVMGLYVQTDIWMDQIVGKKTSELKCEFETEDGIGVELTLWNITKALNLLVKPTNNQGLIMNWLNSPEIYFQTTTSQKLKDFLDPRVSFQNDTLASVGMAKNTLKRVFNSADVSRKIKKICQSWSCTFNALQLIEYKRLVENNIVKVLDDENLVNKYRINKDSIIDIVLLRKKEKSFSEDEVEELISKNASILKEILSSKITVSYKSIPSIDLNDECKTFFRQISDM